MPVAIQLPLPPGTATVVDPILVCAIKGTLLHWQHAREDMDHGRAQHTSHNGRSHCGLHSWNYGGPTQVHHRFYKPLLRAQHLRIKPRYTTALPQHTPVDNSWGAYAALEAYVTPTDASFRTQSA